MKRQRNQVFKRSCSWTLRALSALAAAVLLLNVSCSEEDRDEIINRTSKAAKTLSGSDKLAETEYETPLVVQEEQRKERIRQNMEWTPENRKRYPVEYCQAMLKDLKKKEEQLEVNAHEILTELNKIQRNKENRAGELGHLKHFLDKAKAAYREAEATGKWPVTINGYQLTQERLKKRIVESVKRIKELEGGAMGPANHETRLKTKLELIQKQQREVVLLQERTQNTINDIRTNQVIEGSGGITNSLNAISDSIGALGGNENDPSLEDLAQPTQHASIDEEFSAIMKE